MPRKKISVGYSKDATGIPDSKLHGGSPEADAAFDARPIMDMHVGGVLVRQMPLLTQRLIQYEQTDEGFLEKNKDRTGHNITVDAPREERRYVRDKDGGRFEQVMRSTDALGKALEHQRDDVIERGMDSYDATNPLQELLDRHVPKGFKGKLLAENSHEIGNGYELVKAANGDKVKLRTLYLGITPEKRAEGKNRHYRTLGQERLKQMQEKQVEEHGGDSRVADDR